MIIKTVEKNGNVYEIELDEIGYIVLLNGNLVKRFKSRIATEFCFEELLRR